jgi:GNAT superfamily N-acetyltransferase
MPVHTDLLAGQDTLLSCWRALADTEFGPGRLVETPHATAAVFPDSAYFNNAILTAPIASAPAAAESAADVYAGAGITTWALWVSSDAAVFDGPTDRVDALGSLSRDATTVVMQLSLSGGLRMDDRVMAVSGAALRRLTADEAVPAEEFGEPAADAPVTGWALVQDGHAVASAYTHQHRTDCGIYAVATLPPWRRRGLARVLVEHILAHAHDAGMRTASLQSTPMGLSVYQALGFRAVGRYEEWLHSPAPAPPAHVRPGAGGNAVIDAQTKAT